MNYKEATSRFKTKYAIECKKHKEIEQKLDDTEILMLLSEPYAEICNKHYLVKTSCTVDLVIDQYEYTVGTGASNIPSALLRPALVRLNDTTNTVLGLVSKEDMPDEERASGLPTKYTIDYTNSSRKLIINTLPDNNYAGDDDYRLLIDYYQKIWVYSGTAENTWSTLTIGTGTDWGGSFLNPTEFDELIILGALGSFFNDLKMEYELKKARINEEKNEYYNLSMPYGMGGISNY